MSDVKKIFRVSGMTCAHCEQRIAGAVNAGRKRERRGRAPKAVRSEIA